MSGVLLDQALEIAAKTLLVPDLGETILGDERNHALFAYEALQTVSQAYLEAQALIEDLKLANEALHAVNETAIALLRQRMDDPVDMDSNQTYGAAWRGQSDDYFDHMEEINSEIASAFADVSRMPSNEAQTARKQLEEGS